MFVIYILRDLNVMCLEIIITSAINCTHVYETTPSLCDISLSNVSPGNIGCLYIWHVNRERSQLGMLHDWQLASIIWRSPNPSYNIYSHISITKNNTRYTFAAVYCHSSATSAVFSSIPNPYIIVPHVIKIVFLAENHGSDDTLSFTT